MSIKDSILSHINPFSHSKEKNEKMEEDEKLNKENKIIEEESNNLDSYEEGISVIIPTYKGEKHIKPLLESLETQTLNPDKYELIFIINGELDSTAEILEDFAKKHPKNNINITFTPEAGASNARNVGIELAKKEYVTFLDDDDFISSNYLEKLLEYSKPNRIVIANFLDYDFETEETKSNMPSSLNEYGTIKEGPVKFISIAAVTIGKSIPAYAIKRIRYNTDLTSGEDVSFYASLYSRFDFEFYLIDAKEEVNYYRVQRNKSVSNQEMSYQFNVLDRLKVMDDLDKDYRIVEDERIKKYIEMCFRGQTGFTQRYLQKHPEDRDKTLKEVEKHNFKYFPYHLLED